MNNRTGILNRIVKFLTIFLFLSCQLIAQVDQVDVGYERLSERILVVWGGKVYKDQVVAIASEKGIVMIDAGKSPTLTGKYRTIIEREFGSDDFKYLINTHHHFDHTAGNQIFPEAIIIAHQKTPGLMETWAQNRRSFIDSRRRDLLPGWISQRDRMEPGSEEWKRFNDIVTTQIVMLDDYENNYILTLPDIIFNDRLTLDMGDVTFRLYYWSEGLHAGDDILIYCPEERILFSGDLFHKNSFTFTYSPIFDGERQISIMAEIFKDENSVKWIYDCHNGRMAGTFISLYHRYMKDVWETLLKAKEKGMDLNTIMNDYSYEKRFSYIINSGIDAEVLRRQHTDNLKFTWYSINGTQSAAAILEQYINEKGIKVTVLKYNEMKNRPGTEFFFAENEFNRLGYTLMNAGKIKEAIEIFKINVEKYPGSGKVYESLGEAYINDGQKELAIKNYKKSLELNPNNNAVDILEKLKSK